MSQGQGGWPPQGGPPGWGQPPQGGAWGQTPSQPQQPQPWGQTPSQPQQQPWGQAPQQPWGQAQPQPSQSPQWGLPPTAQNPFGQTPAQPAGGDGPEAMHEVETPWPLRGMPNVCACCGAAPEVDRSVRGTAQVGRTTQTRTLKIPYCRRCDAHVRAGSRRGWVTGLIAFVVGAPLPWLVQAAVDYVPAAVVFASGVAAALAALAALTKLWPAAPVARDQRCTAGEQEALWIAGFAFNAPSIRLRGVNAPWVASLGTAHGVTPRPAGTRSPTRARWFVAPLGALAMAVPAWFAMHGHVYLDNPSNATLTFDIDDGAEVIAVTPGGHTDVRLPSGRSRVVVKGENGAVLETIRGEVGHGGTHVVTPLGVGCYATLTMRYGTAYTSGPNYVPATPGARWHDLEGVQLVLEPFPRSVSVGRGQTGATRRRFTRVNCGDGSPIL